MSVTILDTPVVRTGALNYTPTAGSKWAILYVARRNSSGSATAPTSVTLGGVSCTLLAGVAGLTQTRCASTIWGINESQISSMSGDSIVVTGGSGTTVVTSLSIGGNPRQTAPTASGYISSASSTTTRSLTISRKTGGFTLHIQHWNFVGSPVTMTPTRIFNTSDGGSTHSIGYITETVDSVSTSWSDANTSAAASYVAVSFEEVPAIDINTINGSAFGAVNAGSTGNTVTTTASFVPTSGTHGGKAISSIAGSAGSYTFTSAAYVDGATFPEPDTAQTFALTDGVSTPTASSVLSSPDGMASVVLVTPNSADSTYPAYYFAMTAGDRLVYPTEGGNFSIGTDSGVSTTTAGTRVCWHWNHTTQIMTQLNITVNDAGEVTGATGLTSSGLTSSGLTRAGLTSAGL